MVGEKLVFCEACKVCKPMRDRRYCLINIDQESFDTLRDAFIDDIAWISNYKETGKPLDFYSNKHKLIVEVMSVNDNERSNNKGKISDPVKIQSEKMINAIILLNSKLSKLSREKFHKVS